MTTPLPPQDPREPDEALPGEAELSALYHRLPQDEPGPALDAAVLRAAAQALAPDEGSSTVRRERGKAERKRGDRVHPKTNPSTSATPVSAAGGRRRPRWLITLSSAATLVLAAGLAWHMRQPPSPTAPSTAATSAASPEVAAAPVPRAAPTRAAMPSDGAMPPPPEPPKQPPPRVVAARPSAPASVASHKAAADRAERSSGAAHVDRRAQPASVAAPAMLQETAESSAAEVSARAMPAAPPATAATPVAEVVAGTTAAADADTPAGHLDRIRQLFAQHRDDEARQQLEAFHRVHPDWDLSPELRAQLRKP